MSVLVSLFASKKIEEYIVHTAGNHVSFFVVDGVRNAIKRKRHTRIKK